MNYAQPNFAKSLFSNPGTTKVKVVKLNTAGIEALQSQLMTAYPDLSFTFTGVDFNFDVTLVGSVRALTGSINLMFPDSITDEGIVLQPNQWGPTYDKYFPEGGNKY